MLLQTALFKSVQYLKDSSPKNDNSVIIFSPSKPVWISFFMRTQKKIFWRMLVDKQLLVSIDLHDILQNILFCVKQKKEIHTSLEQHESE